MKMIETQALILYNRNFKEDDKLVKIFTELAGKRMFFVKHVKRSQLGAVIQPLVKATLIVKINEEGLSYIQDYKAVDSFIHIQEDIYCLAHATYLMNLADAAINDSLVDAALFQFLIQILNLMNQGLDAQVLTLIFEVQVLQRFGVSLNFEECSVCHQKKQAFDFSFSYSGLLCPKHYHLDEKRSHLHPNVPYLLQQFQMISLQQLKTISLKEELKQELRNFMDQVYDNYVGIELKSKKFIRDLETWGSVFKKEENISKD